MKILTLIFTSILLVAGSASAKDNVGLTVPSNVGPTVPGVAPQFGTFVAVGTAPSCEEGKASACPPTHQYFYGRVNALGPGQNACITGSKSLCGTVDPASLYSGSYWTGTAPFCTESPTCNSGTTGVLDAKWGNGAGCFGPVSGRHKMLCMINK